MQYFFMSGVFTIPVLFLFSVFIVIIALFTSVFIIAVLLFPFLFLLLFYFFVLFSLCYKILRISDASLLATFTVSVKSVS